MTNARIAGFAILLYMAIGVTVMVLMNRATSTDSQSARNGVLGSRRSLRLFHRCEMSPRGISVQR